MPESMFGSPSQHLLPSQPQDSSGASSGSSDPHAAPVHPSPPTFKDFRFNSIGKEPDLLSRISLPQPDGADYHSPTPSPTSTPPPTLTNDLQTKSSSRPTLLQQLAGSDFSSMSQSGGWNPSTNQSNGSLASRIQMSGSPSNDIVNTHRMASRFPTPPLRFSTISRATEDASLIPPVEFLSQPPDSTPPAPASWAPTIEPTDVDGPTYSTPLANMSTIPPSRPSSITMDTASKGPTEAFPSLTVPDTGMREAQPLPSATAATDVLVTRQGRLQSISAQLANLTAPIPQSSPQSPPPDISLVRTSADVTPNPPSQLQHTSTPIVLHHPYSAHQPSDRLGINNAQIHASDSSLALVLSPTNLAQDLQTQSRVAVAAFQNLESAFNTAHRILTENEKALALRMRSFEEQRAAFEQTKYTEGTKLQQDIQELQQKREALSAKETMLALLEKENKDREESRKAVLAKRQVQEEEMRVAEAKRVQDVQEKIEAALNELKEFEAPKAKRQVEQLAIETVQDDLPTEPQEDMNEEERAAIKSRNELLLAVRHLRRMHTDKVQKLEETNRTLRRLGVERKHREAAVEEERLRVERGRQLLDEKRRQLEAERKHQEDENVRLLAEQQAHAEAQARGLRRTKATNFEHLSRLEEASASQRQGIADTTKIRGVLEDNSFSAGTTDAMNVDEDGRAFHVVLSSDISTSPRTSQSKHKKKKDKSISGGVMLAASTSKANGTQIPPKRLTTPPSLPSSDHTAENAPIPPSPPPVIPMFVEGAHRLSQPAQLASGLNRGSNVDVRPTSDYKPAFSRTPKSQTILDATNVGSQELNIGPVSGVSPTQQNVNLRHLKRYRSRAEGNDSGDRSVRTVQVKSEESLYLSPKREEHDERAREVVQTSISNNLPPSLPPRPAVIPPPRPQMTKKRPKATTFPTNLSSSYPPENNTLSSKRREADVATEEQSREALPQDTPSSQAMIALDQLSAPYETTNSLLLGPVCAESQPSEPRGNAGVRPTQDRGENYGSSTSEPASATLSHELDGEDSSRGTRGFSDEHSWVPNTNGSRRASDRYSPRSTSPTQVHRSADAWRPTISSSRPRAELMRATSPIAGRKRLSEFNDNEHGRRARRRGDVWIAQDHDRDRVDSYRPQWDRRVDSDPDERRAAYRSPTSPHDRTRPFSTDVPRAPYDNRTYAPEEPAAPPAHWEQSYRRIENDDIYQRYSPSAPAYSETSDQHHVDDARVGQSYEPMTVERLGAQPDPSLLARIHDTQRFPPRGRGRGEPSRGRGDFGRGRGRGAGTPLIERLTTAPSSLGDRLT